MHIYTYAHIHVYIHIHIHIYTYTYTFINTAPRYLDFFDVIHEFSSRLTYLDAGDVRNYLVAFMDKIYGDNSEFDSTHKDDPTWASYYVFSNNLQRIYSRQPAIKPSIARARARRTKSQPKSQSQTTNRYIYKYIN